MKINLRWFTIEIKRRKKPLKHETYSVSFVLSEPDAAIEKLGYYQEEIRKTLNESPPISGYIYGDNINFCTNVTQDG